MIFLLYRILNMLTFVMCHFVYEHWYLWWLFLFSCFGLSLVKAGSSQSVPTSVMYLFFYPIKGIKKKRPLCRGFSTLKTIEGLLYPLLLNKVPSFISRGAAHQQAWALSSNEGRNYVYLNLASKFVTHERTRSFYMPQSWDMGQMFYFPSEGRHAENFSTEKIRRLQLGVNPRSWIPETSMLTTRPPKPLPIKGSVNLFYALFASTCCGIGFSLVMLIILNCRLRIIFSWYTVNGCLWLRFCH
jgi:hypothetical protein